MKSTVPYPSTTGPETSRTVPDLCLIKLSMQAMSSVWFVQLPEVVMAPDSRINARLDYTMRSLHPYFIVICIEELDSLGIIDSRVKDKWPDIGTRTGQSNDLETIRTKTMLNNKDACREVFAVWIDKDGHPKYPLTWQGLYDLLCDVGHRNIANTVADKKNAQGAGILKK